MHMNLEDYKVLDTVDLGYWFEQDYQSAQARLFETLQALHRAEYHNNERIVFTYTGDFYVGSDVTGLILKNLQIALNEVDISNYFAVIATTNPNIELEMATLKELSADPVGIAVIKIPGEFERRSLTRHPHSVKEQYQYGSSNPIKIGLDDLSDREKFLLTESKTFCIYPWIHLHAYPTGDAYPCCHAEMQPGKIGNARTHSLKEIWNSPAQRRLRLDMLSETPNAACTRCYEQEESGFFSGRKSANKHHGHHINRVAPTKVDGWVEQFEMTYWDIRFSNLCNLKCRSCGHIFSSQWYQDQAKLAGPGWKLHNSVLNYAGPTETSMWEQLEPHLDYVEQIYFAGGEPLLMAEHYNILEELLKRGRTDVRLIYNTNFTHTDLKGRSVFEYWKQFESVAVGASLDDSGARAEYIRKGTDWAVVEQNRRDMLAICPQVDFYISPTLSIMNARHLPQFHRDWVEKGLIRAQDLNVNILQDPPHYRIDIATPEYKEELSTIYLNHILWLRDQDSLNRATQGFESAVTFMNSTDNTHLIPRFWEKTNELDSIRNERLLDVIPELHALVIK